MKPLRPLRLAARRAFTLIELLLAMGIITTMVGMGITGYHYQHQRSAGLACGNNLRLIQEAKRAALEENPTLTSFDDATLEKYLPGGAMPTCPGNGTYQNTDSLGTVCTCSLADGKADGLHTMQLNGLVGGQVASADTGGSDGSDGTSGTGDAGTGGPVVYPGTPISTNVGIQPIGGSD